jgi:hypothetical protein
MLMYKPTDRIPVEFLSDTEDAFTLLISPLTVGDKAELMAQRTSAEGSPEGLYEFSKSIVRKVVKGCRGLKLTDGNEWVPQFDCGIMTEDSALELMNTEICESLILVGAKFMQGVPKEGAVLDPRNGQPMPGIVVKKI